MALGHFALASTGKKLMLREKESGKRWKYQTAKNTSPAGGSLEEEIRMLRMRMEQLFIKEQSLTSPRLSKPAPCWTSK
ncbi:hypothetical protein N6H14_02265 [Paenibacillus sp. CC-CFT747]|nr:hypothetical protein N6H14_02265 [Paenibacillus sp. CC-CFT747]